MPDRYIENYCQNAGENKIKILISSLAQLNPITSAMAEVYNQQMEERRWRYIEEFFQEVKRIMENHEGRLRDLENEIDPYENIQLLHITIDNVKLEHRETKRKEYAELFVNSILLGNQINFDEKRMFIQLFSELLEADITLLGKFFENSAVIENGSSLENFRKFDLTEIVPLVVRLESRGLIAERYDVNKERWEGSKRSFENIWRNKVYALTPPGIRFCKFLKGEQ